MKDMETEISQIMTSSQLPKQKSDAVELKDKVTNFH